MKKSTKIAILTAVMATSSVFAPVGGNDVVSLIAQPNVAYASASDVNYIITAVDDARNTGYHDMVQAIYDIGDANLGNIYESTYNEAMRRNWDTITNIMNNDDNLRQLGNVVIDISDQLEELSWAVKDVMVENWENAEVRQQCQVALDKIQSTKNAWLNVRSQASSYLNTTDITNEVTRSTEADATLQSNIDAEAQARQVADATLQSNIDAEAQTRAAADATLQSNIDAEAQARQVADATLQSNIDAEAQARAAADAALQSNIDAEAQTRAAADATLQSNIEAEAQARQVADATLQSNIDAEEAARIAADNAEAQTRAERDAILQSNIEAEVNARIAAINAEKNARMAQDEILQNNIDLEAATRFQADRLLQFNIDSEAEARRAGDAALDQKIMNETYARQREDRAIRDEMNAGFQRLDEKINNGVAMSLAVAGLKMPEYDPNHKLSGAIGFGHFHSANAFAVGVFYQFNRDVSINLSYARSGSEGGISAGVSFKF